ncbi:family 43 glycosylhydrolase [Luteibacter yeojuensis]|uniref:family 43 glycosylhydrolase n=1 Tax=Luteibacter yeojuensis TaxID=345309 RepID=UPI000696E77C|nr:family 43 glycosylhydrolase [Luteibacter yeojuensis]
MRRLIALFACVLLAGPLLASTVRNGAPGTFRLDDQGNAIDAHDGDLQYFNGRYYLYGTQYGCGYQWNQKGTPFCGFRVYSSADLAQWHDEGALFDAATPAWQARCDGGTYGCYRPHVVYNARTQRYVLWINSYDVGVGYHVFTARTPTGPFNEVALPRLAVNAGLPPGLNHGDHDVFVDDDGTAYLAYTDWRRKGDIVVEKLDGAYTSGSGAFVRLGLTATEAPSLFRRGGRYYLTFSDPNCGYCATGTSYMRASSPLGPWSGRAKISKDSCGGQPADVATLPGKGAAVYLYQSDRWDHAERNEGLATHYQEPLRFDEAGGIAPLACAASVDVPLASPATGATAPVAIAVPILPGKPVMQAVRQEGGNGAIRIPLYRHGAGEGVLHATVRMQGAVVATRDFPAASLSWSPRVETVTLATPAPAGAPLTVMLEARGQTPAFGTLRLQPRVP